MDPNWNVRWSVLMESKMHWKTMKYFLLYFVKYLHTEECFAQMLQVRIISRVGRTLQNFCTYSRVWNKIMAVTCFVYSKRSLRTGISIKPPRQIFLYNSNKNIYQNLIGSLIDKLFCWINTISPSLWSRYEFCAVDNIFNPMKNELNHLQTNEFLPHSR